MNVAAATAYENIICTELNIPGTIKSTSTDCDIVTKIVTGRVKFGNSTRICATTYSCL